MKNKGKLNNHLDPAVARSAELHKRIEQRAHEIWLASGCSQGDDLRHWLDAEREILATLRQQSRKS